MIEEDKGEDVYQAPVGFDSRKSFRMRCFLKQFICTYSPDVTADHEADVLGERMNQLKQSRTRVWITSQHQTLWPVNMEFNHFLKHQI